MELNKEKKITLWCDEGIPHRIEVKTTEGLLSDSFITMTIYSSQEELAGFFSFEKFEYFENFMKTIIDAARP